MLCKTTTGAIATRTITAGSGITVENGNGVAGQPTITNSGVTMLNNKTGVLNAVLGKGKKGSVAQAISTNALTKLAIAVDIGTEDVTVSDANDNFTITTGNAGFYEISYDYSIRHTIAGNNDITTYIYKNSAVVADEILTTTLVNGIYENVSYSTILELQDADVIDVRVQAGNNTAYTIYNTVITVKKIQ
jgi:hypothetical protein